MAEQVQEAARILGIEHLLDRLPWQLSGGDDSLSTIERQLIAERDLGELDT